MNNNFLTFEYINKFKGILIILIIAEHIEGLGSLEVNTAILSFHVTSFFFLPFLFNNDKLTLFNMVKIFKRYYVPYTVFFLVSYIAYRIIFHNTVSISDASFLWLTGTMYTLKEAIGIGAYWFFPALIALLISIMFHNSLSDFWKKVFIVFAFISHLFIGFFAYPKEVLRYIPFDLYVPLYLFFLGYIIKNIIYTVELTKNRLIVITLIFIISLILSYSYGESFNIASPYFPSILTRPVDFILRDTLMISGFFSILFITKYIPYTSLFGIYSIAIYTLHPLIIQAVHLILRSETFSMSILKFFIVLSITFTLAHIIYKFKINKLIYPK
jgi:fucose 4-O-acetylase-like acetyltransferase